MTKKTSLTDVAELAGVSRTTVSYVLNHVTTIHISEKTRQRVLDAARELHYHPNASARSLAQQRTLTLGLVLCTSHNRLRTDAFLPAVLYGVSSITAPAGYRMLVQVLEEDATSPDTYINLVHEARIDGIILAGVRSDDPQLPKLRAENFPVVIWGQLPGNDFPFVDVDNVRAAQMAVEHLVSLGHQRIACITNTSLRSHESADRLRGYQTALRAHDLPLDDSLVGYGNHSAYSGFEAMRSLLALSERPSAVFAASDVMALGALRAARDAGLRVPHDLALVGFDDVQFAEYVVPSLTTVQVPAQAIGATAARMVLDIIQTGNRPAPILLETELVIRESCGAQL